MNNIFLFSKCIQANTWYENGSYIPGLSNIKSIATITLGTLDLVSGLYYLVRYKSLDKVPCNRGSVKDLLCNSLECLGRGFLEQIPIVGNIALAILDTHQYAHQSKQKIVLYGLTADPPHKGHLSVIQALQKDRRYVNASFIIVPVGIYANQSKQTKADKEHRLNMTKILFKSIPNTRISNFEFQKDSPSVAITTIQYFKKKYRYANLHYIVSADAANGFSKWFNYQKILSLVTMIIMPRKGFSLTDDAKKLFNKYSASFIQPDTQPQTSSDPSALPFSVNGVIFQELSSTDVRERLSKNERLEECLTLPIMAYIQEQELYGSKKTEHTTPAA